MEPSAYSTMHYPGPFGWTRYPEHRLYPPPVARIAKLRPRRVCPTLRTPYQDRACPDRHRQHYSPAQAGSDGGRSLDTRSHVGIPTRVPRSSPLRPRLHYLTRAGTASRSHMRARGSPERARSPNHHHHLPFCLVVLRCDTTLAPAQQDDKHAGQAVFFVFP